MHTIAPRAIETDTGYLIYEQRMISMMDEKP